MKKLIISLLLVVLVIPSLALAEEGKGTRRSVQREGAHRWDGPKLKPVAGRIVSLTASTVTVAMPVKSKDAKAKFKYVKVRTSEKPGLRGLLAKGLGRKGQLLCRKTDKGAWVLVRIKSIKGVEVPRQGARRAGARERLPEKGQTISHEQLERMETRPLAQGPRRPANPQIAKLEQRSQQLAKRYRQAKGQEKEELNDRLRGTLSEVFKLKVRMQAKQIERLKKQLDKLRERLEKRERNREGMIQKRLGQLTGEEENLPW